MLDDAPRPRAIIFDLDEVLVDARPAWIYAVEETVLSLTGERIRARELVEEYRRRPLRDSLSIWLRDPESRMRGERMVKTMLERSALKRLLVHEGVGVTLNELRVRRIEMGAISRYAHPMAMQHLQSTGLDRFFTVLSPTPPGEQWLPKERIAQCLSYLEQAPRKCAFVSGEPDDISCAQALGMVCVGARWAGMSGGTCRCVAGARDLPKLLLNAWSDGPQA